MQSLVWSVETLLFDARDMSIGAGAGGSGSRSDKQKTRIGHSKKEFFVLARAGESIYLSIYQVKD